MKAVVSVLVLATAILSSSGCAWVADVLGPAIGERTIRDGRDKDSDGLTRRDIVARGEEQAIRRFENDRSNEKWKRWNERQAAQKQPDPFGRQWQDHLTRDRN